MKFEWTNSDGVNNKWTSEEELILKKKVIWSDNT